MKISSNGRMTNQERENCYKMSKNGFDSTKLGKSILNQMYFKRPVLDLAQSLVTLTCDGGQGFEAPCI